MRTHSFSSSLRWTLVGLAVLPFLAVAEEEDLPFVWNAPTVHLLWADPYDLFPASAFAGMSEEIVTLFRAQGISVEVHELEPGDEAASLRDPAVHAVLHPVEPVAWRLHRDVMAAAVGERGKGHTIFVFYPSVMRTLGQGDSGRTVRRADLSRGMGRIVAHELVHVLAPERGHASHGVMASALSRRVLTAVDARLDPKSARAARGGLRPDRPARTATVSPAAPAVAYWY